MTAYEAMRRRAIAEFDQLVAQQEATIRATMAAAGTPRAEIDRYVADCQPGLEDQRRQIASMVASEFAKHGVPMETPAHAWQ